MNRHCLRVFSAFASVLLLLSGMMPISAENGNKTTPNCSQSIIGGKKAVFCGYTTDLYRFKFNGGSENFWSMLTDGIIADSSGNSQLNQIYSSGTGKYSAYGTNFVLIYDLEKYYDLASVALYSFHSDSQEDVVWQWDVYASDKKSDLLTVSKMVNGKKGFDDPLDLQIPVFFRHVRYLAFAMRCENPSGLLKVSEIEAFGVPSKDQNTEPDNYIYNISDQSVKIKAESSSFSSDLNVNVSSDDEGADQAFLIGLGYYYIIHKTFNITSSGTELASGTKYTVILPIPKSLSKKSELCVAQKNENETVLINADIQDGYATFTTYSLGEFALVEPNYELPEEHQKEETESSETTDFVSNAVSSTDSAPDNKPERVETKPTEPEDNGMIIWIIAAAVVLVAVVTAVLIVIKKKRIKSI